MIVAECARLAAAGADHDEVVAQADALIGRTKLWGAVDTLENLKKGGRIGGAKAMLATALSIKPIIEVRDGKVEQGGKQRTRSKALAFLVDKVASYGGGRATSRCCTPTATTSTQFVDMLAPVYGGEIVVGDIGPVVGSHAGKGTIGVTFHGVRAAGVCRIGVDAVQRPQLAFRCGHAHCHHALHRCLPPLLAQRYRLERRLAQGGMAEVWLATDTLLSRQVAVKLLKPTLAADPVVAERFRREAIAVARLNHPNIVAVYDTIDDGGRQAVVMQLVNGKSLRQLLDEQKRLSPELTIHIGTLRRRRARRRPPAPASSTATSSPATSSITPGRARAAHRLRHRQGPPTPPTTTSPATT